MFSFGVRLLTILLFLTSLVSGSGIWSSNAQTKSEDIHISWRLEESSARAGGDGVHEEVRELESHVVYYLHVTGLPSWARFVLLQAHVHLHNLTLKYTIDTEAGRHVTGQDVGLVGNVTAAGTAQFFIENENPFNVSTLLAVIAYNKSAPVPGGCNLEFAVETSPWLGVEDTGATVVVSSQPARGPSTWGAQGSCNAPYLQYQGYLLYLPEQDFTKQAYFEFIRKMLTVERIQQNGRKVASTRESEMRHVFSAYHGTGSVYALVVYARPGEIAAYVPAFTYACSPAHYTDTCQVLTSTFSRCLCALVLFIGLFVCFFGHSFFQTELFLFSTLVGGIVAYVLIVPHGLADSTNVMLSTLAGLVAGNVWLLLWWLCGSPLLSILVAILALGSLSASLTLYYFLGDNPYMRSDVNYWLAFACVVLVVALLVAPHTNRVNILACSVVGAYATLVPLDHYIGANLKYVFIDSLRRATVPNFRDAVIDPPLQTKDTILAFLWVFLSLVGYWMQSQRFGDRPAFPSRPSRGWGWSSEALPPTPSTAERRPLLYGQPVTLVSGSTDSVFT